jgi:hypothetical protein
MLSFGRIFRANLLQIGNCKFQIANCKLNKDKNCVSFPLRIGHQQGSTGFFETGVTESQEVLELFNKLLLRHSRPGSRT